MYRFSMVESINSFLKCTCTDTCNIQVINLNLLFIFFKCYTAKLQMNHAEGLPQNCFFQKHSSARDKRPSIYDVHTERGGGQAQMDACGLNGGGPRPMWTSTQKIKIRVH